MWARNGNIAGKKMEWNNAKSWANNLNYGGYSNWRLPTKDEFASFAKRGGNRPSAYFNSNGFNGVQAGWYWSGTVSGTKSGDYSSAWGVDLSEGNYSSYGRYNGKYVWPVRDGQ